MQRAFHGLLTAASAITLWTLAWGCSTRNNSATVGGCSSNSQCLNGHECSGGSCVPYTACPAAACGVGQTCVAGVCRSGCSSDAQCGALICDETQGVCQPAPNPVGSGGSGNVAAGGANPNGGSPASGGTPAAGGSPANGGSPAGGGSGGSDVVPGECPTDPNLALHGGWVGCDPALTEDNPMGLQGSLYMYHDGTTCTSPVQPCDGAGCCIAGSTSAVAANWGCGLGFELNSSGGDAPMKNAYTGPAKCFDIALTGNSGGNPVRIGYTQAAVMDGKVAPFLELKPITNGFTGTVCINDVACPTEWMPPPDCMKGGPFDLQIQVVGGKAAGAFNLCLTSLVPKESSTGLTNLGQVCGIVGENEKEHVVAGPYRIQNNVANAGHGQQCTSAKAGGGVASMTVDSGSLSSGDNSPVAYPSIAYGWHFGQVTTGTGLPKVLSSIKSAPSTVMFTLPQSGGKYNAAYDIWAMPASKGNNPATPEGGVEIMIWLAAGGGPVPLGQPSGNPVTIGGHDYQIYLGTNSTWQVVTFWAKDFIPGWTDHDLKPFFDRVVSLGKAGNDWNLHSIEFGFEIWSSAPGFAVTNFKQAVN